MKKSLIAIISLTLALTLTFLILCIPSAANGANGSIVTNVTDNATENTESTTTVVDNATESTESTTTVSDNVAESTESTTTVADTVVENAEIITNVSETDCIHEFVAVTGTTFHGLACSNCAFILEQTPHELTAREAYHQWDCEKCGRTRVYHDEDNMKVLVKNEFFHVYSCATCGYEYAESHNFSTAYNSEYHQEICVDCGYAADAEAHVMVNDFYGNYHDIQCDFCGYMAEHHVGTYYETVDSTSCVASCNCGVVENIEHDWDGFVCDNCNYTMAGDTYAIVGRISKNEDDYRVRFIDNNGTHRVDMWDVAGFEEGDLVKISHYGNDIFNITMLVDGDIVNDEENFYDYILSDEINEKSEELTFEDLVIEEFEYNEDHLRIKFESTRSTWFFSDEIIVYDLIDGAIGEISECYAYLTMHVDNTTYFICFW